jgi:hypothetical protein
VILSSRDLHESCIDEVAYTCVDVFAGSEEITRDHPQIELHERSLEQGSLFVSVRICRAIVNVVTGKALTDIPADHLLCTGFVDIQLKMHWHAITAPDKQVHVQAGEPAFALWPARLPDVCDLV